MTYARKRLISLDDTRYYHVVARCVRRAWLWGFDEYAGKDYSHRKHWVLEKLKALSECFSIEICAYAVMSNHYHLVLHVDVERARAWSEAEVVERWITGFRCPVLVDHYLRGEWESEAMQDAARILIEEWRRRLTDISWFMRMLNEYLARRANREDECQGRFWGVPRTWRKDPLRCCGEDEGGPLDVAVQTVTSNRPLLLRPKGVVVSEWERRRTICVG